MYTKEIKVNMAYSSSSKSSLIWWSDYLDLEASILGENNDTPYEAVS